MAGRLDVRAACPIGLVGIAFESNGGQAKAEATVPEIRLAVAEPNLDVGNVDTVLEALSSTCYYLTSERNRYRFSLSPNLNKLLADRRANIPSAKIEECVRAEVQKVFSQGSGVQPVNFPEKSSQVPNQAVLTFVVLGCKDWLARKKYPVRPGFQTFRKAIAVARLSSKRFHCPRLASGRFHARRAS